MWRLFIYIIIFVTYTNSLAGVYLPSNRYIKNKVDYIFNTYEIPIQNINIMVYYIYCDTDVKITPNYFLAMGRFIDRYNKGKKEYYNKCYNNNRPKYKIHNRYDVYNILEVIEYTLKNNRIPYKIAQEYLIDLNEYILYE